MSKALEDLAKDLATGLSRRTALKRFFVAFGAAVGTLVGSRRASADDNAVCVALCRDQELSGKDFGACVAASAHCPPGECAWVTNGGPICVPVDTGC
jgi:hypothetical protein